MKRNGNLRMVVFAGGLLGLIIGLAGCSGQATATPEFQGFGGEGSEGGFRGGGDASPEFAAFGRSRTLALDTLYLQDSDTPLSADQTAALLPLWQQVKTLEEAETVNADDLTGVLDQIETELTAEQSDLLASTAPEDLAGWAQAKGIQGAFGPGFGGGRSPGGEGDSGGARGGDDVPSDEAMATFQAALAQGTPAPGAGGGDGAPQFEGTPPARRFNNTALIDQVIAMLEAL